LNNQCSRNFKTSALASAGSIRSISTKVIDLIDLGDNLLVDDDDILVVQATELPVIGQVAEYDSDHDNDDDVVFIENANNNNSIGDAVFKAFDTLINPSIPLVYHSNVEPQRNKDKRKQINRPSNWRVIAEYYGIGGSSLSNMMKNNMEFQ
jgi:hypothetical protein